jgi:hypothetical protein
MLLLKGPISERAATLVTLQRVYDRLVASGLLGPELFEVNSAIVSCHQELGQREAALATAERGHELRKQLFGVSSVEAVEGVLSVAWVLMGDEPERAVEMIASTFLALESELGEAHPATLRALAGLAFTHQQLGHFDEASALYDRHWELQSTLSKEEQEPDDGW